MRPEAKAVLNNLFECYPKLEGQKRGIANAFETMTSCCKAGGKLLICGNGGSAADSEHIVGELMKGFMLPRTPSPEEQASLRKVLPKEQADYFIRHLQRGIPAISLVSQSGLFSAYVNDVAADMAFAQQVFVYAKPEDALFAITTSGASVSVLNALRVAKAIGIKSILLMGNRNFENSKLADIPICVDESETYRIQELHLPIYHALCASVEAELFA